MALPPSLARQVYLSESEDLDVLRRLRLGLRPLLLAPPLSDELLRLPLLLLLDDELFDDEEDEERRRLRRFFFRRDPRLLALESLDDDEESESESEPESELLLDESLESESDELEDDEDELESSSRFRRFSFSSSTLSATPRVSNTVGGGGRGFPSIFVREGLETYGLSGPLHW